MSGDITVTLKDGTPYTITPQMQKEYLFDDTAPKAFPDANSNDGNYFAQTFANRGIDLYGISKQASDNAAAYPQAIYTPAKDTNSYFYEQEFQKQLDSELQDGLLVQYQSDNAETKSRAAAKLAINQYLNEKDPNRIQANAQAIELKIREAQESLGRELSPEEIQLYTQIHAERIINDTLDDVGDNLPLNMLANPKVQELMDSETLKVLTGKWQADHPRPTGFFSDIKAGWARTSALGDLKSRETKIAISNHFADKLDKELYEGAGDLIRSSEKPKNWETLVTEQNIIDMIHGTEGGIGYKTGEVMSGMLSPYLSLEGAAALSVAAITRNPTVAKMAFGSLEAADYFGTNAFDIAYQAAQINKDLQNDFQGAIVEAAPEAAAGALMEAVEGGFIISGGIKAGSKIVNSLRKNAKDAPSINKADGILADKIEANSQKFRDTALGGLIEGFAKAYPQAFATQALTTGVQGALTQHGINRLAGVDENLGDAGIKAVKDNLGTIAVLSLIPGGLSGISYAVKNKNISSALQEHSDRLESEAMATSAPISDISPAAAEQLFSMLGDKQYRFSASDIVQKYKEQGMSREEFLQRFEKQEGDFKDLEELAASGGDIVMSKSHWDAFYAKDLADGKGEAYEFLNPFLRSDKTDVSLDELKDKLTPENLAQFRQEVLDSVKDVQIADSLEGYIRADITAKLRDNKIGKASLNEYLTALHANLFHSLQESTGIDGKVLYDTYKSEFKSTGEILNLSGKERAEDNITSKGGMYDTKSNTYILADEAGAVTAVHEFGHALLTTLNKIANDADFKGDKSKVKKTLEDLKSVLGFSKDAPIDEKMQEKFVAAMLGSILTKPNPKASKDVQTTKDSIITTDYGKLNPLLDKMRRSMAMSLYSTYKDLKKELDEKVAKGEKIDVAQRLAIEEYKQRFGDESFTITPEMQDFFSKHILGNLAYEQHVQLAGLHGIFDSSVLKEHFPEYGELIDDLNAQTNKALDNLRTSHEQFQEVMNKAMVMSNEELDNFKKELTSDFKAANEQVTKFDETLKKSMESKRKEFIKSLDTKVIKEKRLEAIGQKAYDAVIAKAEKAFNKEQKGKLADNIDDFNLDFRRYSIALSSLQRANKMAQEFNLDGPPSKEQVAQLNEFVASLKRPEISYGQPPHFQVQFTENGLVHVELNHPYKDLFEQLAKRDEQGNIITVKSKVNRSSPAYDTFELDQNAVKNHFASVTSTSKFTPDESVRAEANAAKKEAIDNALANSDAMLDTEINRMADEHMEQIRGDVVKEVEDKLGFSADSSYNSNLNQLMACIDAVRSIRAKADKANKMQQQEYKKLESSASWKVLEYFRGDGNTTDKLNYDDAVRVLGQDTAQKLLNQGAAALDGEITFDRFGQDGPLASLLNSIDSKILKQVEREAMELAQSGLGKKMDKAQLEQLKPTALGAVIARKMTEYGNKNAHTIVQERVMHRILNESNKFILDALKDNPTIQALVSHAFDRVSKAERNLFNKISKEIKTHSDTSIKRLSDAILARTAISDISIFRMTRAAGKARDKAYSLAFDLAKGPDHMAKIADQLNLSAVLNKAMQDSATRLMALDKKMEDICTFLKRGNKKVADKYDLNTVLVMRVIASRIGIISDTAGTEAKRLLDNNAPEGIKKLLDGLGKDERFTGYYKNHTIPKLEAAILYLDTLKTQAKNIKATAKSIEQLKFDEEARAITDRLSRSKKASVAYKEGDGQRSWSADPLTKAQRWIGITFRTYLVKMEQWCKNIDRSDNGPMLRLIYDPIRKAYDEAAVQKRVAQREANEIIMKAAACKNKGVIHTTMTDVNGKKITFGLTGKYKGNGTMELITFLTHIGNESNLNKLLKGVGITREKFTAWFNEAQKDGTITKEMMDAVQAYWDFNAKYWPKLQQAYQQASGMYAKEIKPRTVLTAFGEYQGGYAPAMRDTDLTIGPLDTTGNLDTLITGNALGEFFGEASFMKERSEGFTQQLKLDLAQQLSNTVNVIHYSHMLAPTTRLYRALNNPSTKLKETIDTYQPEFVDTNLVPWLSRALRDSSSNSPANGMAYNILRTITNRVGISFMFANLSNAAQGVTNLLVAASYIPSGKIISTLSHAVFNYGTIRAQMMDASPFMKHRFESGFDKTIGETMDLELIKSQDLNAIAKGGKATWERSKQFMSHYGYFAQIYSQHFLDTVVWTAAREDAIAKGMTETDAIKHADSAIRLTQGSNDVLDINNVEAGGPILKLFTQFTSYFNTLSNLVMVELRRNMGDNPARINTALRCAHSLALVVVLPAIISDWIAEAFKGNNVFTESEDWQEFMLMHALVPTGKMFSALVPVYGSAGTVAATQLLGGQTFGGLVGTPATIGAFENTIKLARSAITGNEPSKPWQDGLTALGVITGVPIGTALGRRLDYASTVDINTFDEALRFLYSGNLSDKEKEKYR